MKNALLITVAGAIAIGGITFAALHDWSGKSPEKNQTTTENLRNENSNNDESSQNKASYAVSFIMNDQAYRVDLVDNVFSQPIAVSGESDVIEMEKYFTTSLMPKDVYKTLPISDNMIFLTGLQSNLDPNLWMYSERVDEGADYNVRSYNMLTKEKKVLFNKKNSPNKNHAFKPFAISNDNSVVYLEAFDFDSYLNNIEIWELNLSTNAVRKLSVHPYYNTTPTMSPDGKFLLYTAGSLPNDVHVTATQLYVYDLEQNKESLLVTEDKGYVEMRGWIKSK